MSSPSGSSGAPRRSSASGMYSGRPLGSVPTAKRSRPVSPSLLIDSTRISAIAGLVITSLNGPIGTTRPIPQRTTRSSVAERKIRQGRSPGPTRSWPVTTSPSPAAATGPLGPRGGPGRKLVGAKACEGAVGMAPEGPFGLSASGSCPGAVRSRAAIHGSRCLLGGGSGEQHRSEPTPGTGELPSIVSAILEAGLPWCCNAAAWAQNLSTSSSAKVMVRTCWSAPAPSGGNASLAAMSATVPLSGSYRYGASRPKSE
mmetsp:Transcript_64163/g.202826  ORF Transcript_64163/g.202826 Transcript_64163/m.202826 type:complete len:257 (+) Transcript_64163:146-916(+)